MEYKFKSGGQKAQVKKRVEKAMKVMRRVWEVGKKRFGGD